MNGAQLPVSANRMVTQTLLCTAVLSDFSLNAHNHWNMLELLLPQDTIGPNMHIRHPKTELTKQDVRKMHKNCVVDIKQPVTRRSTEGSKAMARTKSERHAYLKKAVTMRPGFHE